MRALVLLALIVLVWALLEWGFRRLKRYVAASLRATNPPRSGNGRGEIPSAGSLVRCAQCGTYVLEERSLLRSGERFCSPECASLFAKSHATRA